MRRPEHSKIASLANRGTWCRVHLPGLIRVGEYHADLDVPVLREVLRDPRSERRWLQRNQGSSLLGLILWFPGQNVQIFPFCVYEAPPASSAAYGRPDREAKLLGVLRK